MNQKLPTWFLILLAATFCTLLAIAYRYNLEETRQTEREVERADRLNKRLK